MRSKTALGMCICWQMGVSSVLGLLASVYKWLQPCNAKAESLASKCMPRHA